MIATMIAALLQVAVDVPAPPVPLPRWMAGCWLAEGERSQTEECWTAPRGEMLLGSSHSFVSDQSTFFEHMRIVMEDGTLVYVAQPGGAPATRFPLARQHTDPATERQTLTFENAANDYPQRIRYQQEAGNIMVAEISMLDGSRLARWTFRRPGSRP